MERNLENRKVVNYIGTFLFWCLGFLVSLGILAYFSGKGVVKNGKDYSSQACIQQNWIGRSIYLDSKNKKYRGKVSKCGKIEIDNEIFPIHEISVTRISDGANVFKVKEYCVGCSHAWDVFGKIEWNEDENEVVFRHHNDVGMFQDIDIKVNIADE